MMSWKILISMNTKEEIFKNKPQLTQLNFVLWQGTGHNRWWYKKGFLVLLCYAVNGLSYVVEINLLGKLYVEIDGQNGNIC